MGKTSECIELKTCVILTPLGKMQVVADEADLYLFDFLDSPGLEKKIKILQKKMQRLLIPGKSQLIEQFEEELKAYFRGDLQEFKTPCCLIGTPFQKKVWEELEKIPYGQTRSYAKIAESIGFPNAFRAVALANKANWLLIRIPCHRVINQDGRLGGYHAGVKKKEWLLNDERAINFNS